MYSDIICLQHIKTPLISLRSSSRVDIILKQSILAVLIWWKISRAEVEVEYLRYLKEVLILLSQVPVGRS